MFDRLVELKINEKIYVIDQCLRPSNYMFLVLDQNHTRLCLKIFGPEMIKDFEIYKNPEMQEYLSPILEKGTLDYSEIKNSMKDKYKKNLENLYSNEELQFKYVIMKPTDSSFWFENEDYEFRIHGLLKLEEILEKRIDNIQSKGIYLNNLLTHNFGRSFDNLGLVFLDLTYEKPNNNSSIETFFNKVKKYYCDEIKYFSRYEPELVRRLID